MYNHKLT